MFISEQVCEMNQFHSAFAWALVHSFTNYHSFDDEARMFCMF